MVRSPMINRPLLLSMIGSDDTSPIYMTLMGRGLIFADDVLWGDPGVAVYLDTHLHAREGIFCSNSLDRETRAGISASLDLMHAR